MTNLDSKQIRLLDLALECIPLYGVFSMIDALKGIDNIFLKEVMANYGGQDHLFIADYLYEKGFLIKRLDLNPDGTKIELTDLGRKLKSSGSFIKYHEQISHEASLQLKMENVTLTNSRLTFWVSVAAIATGILAIVQILDILSKFFCPTK